VADKQYFEWLGDEDASKLPFIDREIGGVTFSGPNHIGVTGDKDKIKFFEESNDFKASTKTAFDLNGGLDPEDVLETAQIGATGLSAGSGAEGQGGNGSSTAG